MTHFIPPGFAVLKVQVANLKIYFNEQVRRYKIKDPKAPQRNDLTAVQRLEILIAQTNLVTSCASNRWEQKVVFTQLLEDEIIPLCRQRDEAQCKTASKYLLGALLHRYFRLIEQYASYNKKVRAPTFFGQLLGAVAASDIRECKLFCAIRAALQCAPDMYGDFLAKDLRTIDAATIVSSLECFKANMLEHNNYKKYEHFKTDDQFIVNLDGIISQHKKKGATFINQYNAIRFLQELVTKLDNEQQQFEAELDRSINVLKKNQPDFNGLNIELIKKHLEDDIAVNELKEKALDVLYTPKIMDQLSTFDYDLFRFEMKQCSSNMASYIIMGACSVVMRCKLANGDLISCMHQVLGTERAPSRLTNADKLIGIRFLSKWQADNSEISLDTTFFGGEERFKSELNTVGDLELRQESVDESQEENRLEIII